MKIDNVNFMMDNAAKLLKEDKDKDTSFKNFLTDAMNHVDSLQKKSDISNNLLAAGKIDNIHQVMIDSAKADVSLQLTVQIRNKILDAYNEIMRMNL